MGRLRRHDQPAAAEPLQNSERNQRPHAPAHSTQCRAGKKDENRALQDDAPAEEIAELSVQRYNHGLSEEVGSDHPRQPLEAAELAHDGRERRRNDRRIERGQQDREQ